jgi:hypothetical protein
MSYRIPVTVERGTMDSTLAWVFPWEVPLIEEVQRGEVRTLTLEEISSLAGAKEVKQMKLPSGGKRKRLNKDEFVDVPFAPGLKEQFETMQKVDPENDPANDPEGEWNRLLNVYGMHPTVALPTVEKVYGNEANFKRALQQFRGKRPEAEEDLSDKSPAEMTRPELMRALKERGVRYSFSAKRDDLEAQLIEEMSGSTA